MNQLTLGLETFCALCVRRMKLQDSAEAERVVHYHCRTIERVNHKRRHHAPADLLRV